ncbi:hypothetical protein FHL15_001822 [Xylaria flabelliformis]|uniref:Protein kinase domain-containing protein n=1 Tax=Xylaria flabelliformis TaxID=2512241 RepID=A0A553IA02_9PEZI|nr:hypothetical protein FHL15_001822 [Xylaria flabelliformis]
MKWGQMLDNLLGVHGKASPPTIPPAVPGQGQLPEERPGPPQARLTRAQLRELAQFEARKIELYFQRHSDQFEYERYLNNGVTGVSCKIRLKSNGDRNTPKSFVIKRAFRENRQLHLRGEERMLELFRGAQHILQLFYVPGLARNPFLGPELTIWTEWIESGTLRDFIDRSKSMDRPLPNRLLLEFFKCLLCFCVAMAWPPNGGMGAPHREEKMPTDYQQRTKKEQIVHADMHCSNGSLNPEGGGHGLVPILKLIDFDHAYRETRPLGLNPGVTTNIRDIGQVMRAIITRNLSMRPLEGEVTVTIGGIRRTFITQGADLSDGQYGNLDPQIAGLVQWCLANTSNRPSLELLDLSLTDLMRRATPNRYADYSHGKYESDNEIRNLVQKLILDANAEQ